MDESIYCWKIFSLNFSSGTVRIGGKKLIGTVSKKLNLKKSQAKLDASGTGNGFENGGGFTISEVEDGKRSVAKHLRGRRASANVLFVPKKLEVVSTENEENNSSNLDLIDPGYGSDKPLFLKVCNFYMIKYLQRNHISQDKIAF